MVCVDARFTFPCYSETISKYQTGGTKLSKEKTKPTTEKDKTEKRAMKIRLKTGVAAGPNELLPVHL